MMKAYPYNDYLKPNTKPGDKLPAPKYLENFYDMKGRQHKSDTRYIMSSVNKNALIICEWDSGYRRLFDDFPIRISFDTKGNIITCEYRLWSAPHRHYGPATLEEDKAPKWYLNGKMFGEGNKSSHHFLNELLNPSTMNLKEDLIIPTLIKIKENGYLDDSAAIDVLEMERPHLVDEFMSKI